MVTQYGMSDKLGLMALSTVSNPYLDGSTMMNCADSTSSAADEEIHKLLMDCYADAKKLLVEHRSLLDEIAMYLLSKETITGDEFMAYVNADSKRLTDGQRGGRTARADRGPVRIRIKPLVPLLESGGTVRLPQTPGLLLPWRGAFSGKMTQRSPGSSRAGAAQKE